MNHPSIDRIKAWSDAYTRDPACDTMFKFFTGDIRLSALDIRVLLEIAESRMRLGTVCEDCELKQHHSTLIMKGDHHGGIKVVCEDRDACHSRFNG